MTHQGGTYKMPDILMAHDGKETLMSNPSSVTPLPKDAGNVTNLLSDWRDGDPSALDRLTPIIYDDLLRLARVRLSREFGDCTLEPAALVHESYMRLADQTRLAFQPSLVRQAPIRFVDQG